MDLKVKNAFYFLEIKELFKLFDVDCDGRISAHDLHTVITSVGKGISLEDVKEIINCLDGNGELCQHYLNGFSFLSSYYVAIYAKILK